MSVKPEQVFLMSGQVIDAEPSGATQAATTIIQCVVVAADPAEAYKHIGAAKPDFRPIGLASLADYENAARNLRASLTGKVPESWSLHVAPGMRM